MRDSKVKKTRKEKEEDLKFNQLLKRELMKWYYGALYAGNIKSGGSKKASHLQQKKCKNL
ncbi:MAG: hypothetical protein ACOY46_07080 [Bacillota bacterium]